MEDIINRLIEVDKQARTMLEQAEAYRKQLDGSREKALEEYRANLLERAERRLQMVQEQEAKASEEAKQTSAQSYEALLVRLDETYRHNHVQWEETIFQRCIGR